MALDSRLRSPRERTLFRIGVVFSSLVWLALSVTVIGIAYGVFIFLFIMMAHALFLAHVKGNGVRLSERQLPQLYARCQASATKLGLEQVPEVYLIQAGGVLNAFATKLLSRQFVVIHAELAAGCADPRQLDFIIAHELGHLSAGHLSWQAFLLPFRILPWLGAAYSRACEYTCDRCGHLVAGDLEQSMRGLAVLAAGGAYAGQVDLEAFMEQRRDAGSFWMAVLELVSTHPYLCKRVAALKEAAAPGSIGVIRRNVFAYPVAPAFALVAGGAAAPVVLVAIIGILAALAVPAFTQYQKRARAAQERLVPIAAGVSR